MKRDTGEQDEAGGAGVGAAVNTVADRFTIPRQPEGLIRRPRLLEHLDRGVAGPLTLVSAPAGTGKTLLVSAWARRARSRGPVAWVTLDTGDESRSRFWASMSEGLGRCGVVVRLPVDQADPADRANPADPAQGGSLSVDAVVSAVAERARLDHGQPVVLIVDCESDLSAAVAEDLECLIRRSAGLVAKTPSSRTLPSWKRRSCRRPTTFWTA